MSSLRTARDTVNAVLAYVDQGLTFDALYGAGDAQRLHTGACPGCPHGPLGWIQPEIGSYRVPHRSFALEGRVIARLQIVGPGRYGKFAMYERYPTYWWVDSSGPSWHSVFVSANPDASPNPVVGDMVPDRHPPTWRQARSRWLWSDRDELTWGTCDQTYCCKSSGASLLLRDPTLQLY